MDSTLPGVLDELGIRLTKTELKLNIRPLLRLVCARLFGEFKGFTDMIVEHVPSPVANARNKIEHLYTGSLQEEIVTEMTNCNANVSLDEKLKENNERRENISGTGDHSYNEELFYRRCNIISCPRTNLFGNVEIRTRSTHSRRELYTQRSGRFIFVCSWTIVDIQCKVCLRIVFC